ncbi:hypothetical protein FNH05_11060 [Amycolatopsis rhizosphaerae]|uniref:DUF4034 domain-containing protein n=1 Tax=Amycolatopsis rhizosphaerae TaxID=2053003 RepID=A0A558CYR5_9PSEU|nr:hypothetical protein [Amycolatopsis rhizosphaerae]TVT53916.1 hypothetical protein FNH05_11060 [Amycolatopsis rhizosphaerae]
MARRTLATEPLPAPVFTVDVAYPEVSHWRGLVEAGDWAALAEALHGLADANDRAFAVATVGDFPNSENLFREIAFRHPADTLSRVLLAWRHINIGSAARTAARARHVSTAQFAVFHDHLRQAEQLLIDVTAREPENYLAWAARLPTAMGLELGQSEARRRYARLAEHQPNLLAAQRSLLQQLCPKWGGSWEDVQSFTRQSVGAAPPGSPTGVLIAEWHLERWLEFRDGGDGERQGPAYLRQPEVHQEIVDAAAWSVLNPAFERRLGWVSLHNTFAAAFSLIGDLPRAAEHFRAVGNLASRWPWAYFGDPAAAFERHRAAALAKG